MTQKHKKDVRTLFCFIHRLDMGPQARQLASNSDLGWLIFVRLGLSRLVLAVAMGCLVGGGCHSSESVLETNHQSAQPLASGQGHVRVAAAADLKFAFEELIAAFAQQHPEIKVQVTYGSSGNFYAQLLQQAPFDLYFSADVGYAQKLVEAGRADPSTLSVYAVGQIVIWVPEDSPIDVEQLGAQALLDSSVQKIAIANPQHAPYGRAAESALRSLGVYSAVESRLVFGENIAQAAQFVESGAADIGVLALSLALAPAMADKGRYWQVPPTAYPQMEQGCVLIQGAQDAVAAQRFQAYVIGQDGQRVLSRFGFQPPGA